MLVALGFIAILGFAILVHALLRAPEGFEDQTGFHATCAGDRPRRSIERPQVKLRASNILAIASLETRKTGAGQSSHGKWIALPTTGRVLSNR